MHGKRRQGPRGPRAPRDEGEKRNQALLQKQGNRKNKVKTFHTPVAEIVERCNRLSEVDFSTSESFRDYPLSDQTIKGLEEAKFTCPTEIQRDSLPYSLTGVDLVGAAKTGSGKTLALIIPLLERLWREGWSRDFGLGALVISPTRELAIQTFDTLKKVGKYHDFSTCLLMGGGNDVDYERRRLHLMNIIVCTPGRLQQHLDENELFQCDNMQMLVIDEADRILDMGFKQQINAIVENLPRERQTLLFSATQTKNVQDLVRVCTKDPVMVSVHEKAEHATPEELKQSYLVCNEEEKVNLLWSFIAHHKHKKTIVFVASCAQARFLYESFCHLRPGTSLLGLWGGMKQNKRTEMTNTFERRQKACLIATDLASRGLDFTGVDWVVQMDAPATVDDYIHRVGRTARMHASGSALMFLSEHQVPAMKKMLAERKIPIKELNHDPARLTDIRKKLTETLAAFPELKEYAQKYVVSYLRSVYFMSNKSIFDVDAIDPKALAESLGLAAIKRIRFLQKRKEGKKLILKEKKVYEGHEFGKESTDDEEKGSEEEDDEDEGLFTVKKRDVFNVVDELKKEKAAAASEEKARTSKRPITHLKEAKSMLKKGIPLNQKVRFDEEGEAAEGAGDGKTRGLDLEKAIERMGEQDKMDRKEQRERQKAARKEKKLKEKEKRKKKERKDDDDECRIGGDSSDEEGSVDLSWLPDPDKKRNDDEDDDESEGSGRGGGGDSDDDDDDEEAMEREWGAAAGGVVGSSDEEDDAPLKPPPAKKKRVANKRATEDAESAALALLAAKFK